MAKAILEFDLNDSDDAQFHLRAIKSADLAIVFWDLLYNNKKKFEWDIEQKKYEDQYDLLNAIYEKIWDDLKDRNINIDELIS